MSEVPSTKATDLLVAAFAVLTEPEQGEVLQRCHQLVLSRQDADSSETAKMIRSTPGR